MPGKSVNQQALDLGVSGAPYAAMASGAMKTLGDLLQMFSPSARPADAPPPMVASPEMMQGVQGAQPVVNPRAPQQQVNPILRYLGLQ